MTAGSDRRVSGTAGGASRPTTASISRCERPSRSEAIDNHPEVEVVRRARRYVP